MGGYGDEIVQACDAVGASYSCVDSMAAHALHATIQARFTTRTHAYLPLWERLVACDSVHSPDGWRAIAPFLNDHVALLFFDADDVVVKLLCGSDLTRILADCTGFVFYVTDAACTFVICFNDHDMLIGCGTAKAWIATLKDVS